MDKEEQAIHKALERLFEKKDVVTPDDVIEEAKNPKSPLHPRFTWDLKAAALKCWREEARSLLQRYEVVIKGNAVREFVHVPSQGGYMTATKTITNVDLWREVWRELQKESVTFTNKLNNWANLAPTKVKPEIQKQAVVVEKAIQRIEKVIPKPKAVSAGRV